MDPAGSFGERTLRPVALWASTALVLLQAVKSPAAGDLLKIYCVFVKQHAGLSLPV